MTTNAVPSNSPIDLLFNAQKLDEVVSSGATQYTDRLGVERLTAAGAMARFAALNPRGAWVTATLYAPRDLVLVSGTWYIALDSHTSGATFAGDLTAHWRPEQGVTAADLASTASAAYGDALVGVLGVETGEVATTQHEVNSRSVNAFAFMTNAQRNNTYLRIGTVDVSGAVQAALNTGRDVDCPQGVYLISTPVRSTTTLQIVRGTGKLTQFLTTTDIETFYTNTSVYGVELVDIQFNNTVPESGGANVGPTKFQVHFGPGASGCTVRRCSFNTALSGSVVRTTHHAGVWFEGANLNNILDCTFGQAQILIGSTDSTIRGGFVYSFCFEYAIKIVSAGDVLIEGVRGILGGPSKGCIWIPGASYMNKIIGCYFGGTYSTMNIGNGITADKQQSLLVTGNTFHEVDGVGIYLTDCAGGTSIVGNGFFAGHPKQNDATLLIPGNQDIYIGGVTYQSSTVTITGNVFDRFLGPVEDGMPGIGKSYAIEFSASGSGAILNIASSNTFSGSSRYFTNPIKVPASNHVVIGNVGVGAEQDNRILGDLALGSGGNLLNRVVKSDIAAAGTVSFPIASGFEICGTLTVSSVRTDFPVQSRRQVWAVSSRDGGVIALTSLQVQDGSGGGKTYTLTMPSAGVVLFTDTSGTVSTVTMTYVGLFE